MDDISEDNRRFLLVFVHGFNSTSDKAWGGFPELIKEAKDTTFKDLNETRYGFKSQICQNHLDISVRGEGLASYLKSQLDKKYAGAILVGHSMGGLVILHALEKLARDGYPVLEDIPVRVMTLGTPFFGVEGADKIRDLGFLCNDLQADEMSLFNSRLLHLREDWDIFFGTHAKVNARYRVAIQTYYGSDDTFVKRDSACGPFPGCDQVDGNHSSMAKPMNTKHLTFVKLVEQIKSLEKGIQAQISKTTSFLSIDPGPRQRQLSVNSPVNLDIEVLLSSPELTPVEDAQLRAELFSKEGVPLNNEDAVTYFSLIPDLIHVPVLTNSVSRRSVSAELRVHRAGEFLMKIYASSKKLGLKAEAEIHLHIDNLGLEILQKKAPQDSPLFIVRGEILDTYPYRISELGEFKAVLVDEIYRSNITKATAWFFWDYVGALGGQVLNIMRDTAPRTRHLDDVRDDHVLQKMEEVKTLEEAGYVENDTVLIGTSFYWVEHLNDQKLRFRRASESCVRINFLKKGDRSPVESIPLSDSSEDSIWTIAQSKLSFSFSSSCGATGRICETDLSINGQSYTDIDGIELPPSTDFPVFIRHLKGRYIKFYLGESLEASDCGPSLSIH